MRGTASQRNLSPGKIAILLATQATVFVALGMLLWHLSGRDLAAFLMPSLAAGSQGIAFGTALIVIAWAIFASFPTLADRLVRLQVDTYRFLGPRLPAWAIGAIALSAGVGEEALFRAGVQVWLGDHLGPIAAIMIASGLFAAFHLGKPIITALLFGVGALFGVVYWLTGSLLTVMVGHVLYDIFALRWLHRSFLRLGFSTIPKRPLRLRWPIRPTRSKGRGTPVFRSFRWVSVAESSACPMSASRRCSMP